MSQFRPPVAHPAFCRPGVAVLLASLALAVGCTQMLSMEGTSKAITEGLASQLAMPIASVKCPDSREIKAGDVFECIATPVMGGRLTVQVTQKDDAGNVAWEVSKTEGLMDLAKVEESVKQGLAQQVSLQAEVACGDRWRATKAGDAFECQAKGREGQAVTVVVTVTDNDGNVSWATK